MEVPRILYKYRDWTDPYHKRLLTHGEIFFASPSSLNDPFDSFYGQLPEGLEPSAALVDRLSRSFPGVPQDALLLLAASIEQHPNRRLAADALAVVVGNTMGVVSLSETSMEPTMWSHYSRNHEGFCVGFNTERLVAACGESVDLHPIAYVKERPDFWTDEYPMKGLLTLHLTTKSVGWSYEREYRLLGFREGNRVVTLPSGTLTEVLLGCRIQANTRREIVAVLKAAPSIIVRQVVRKGQSLLPHVVDVSE